MKTPFLYLTLISYIVLLTQAIPIQTSFMAPEDHGDIWSLCDNPTTHQLIGYKDGVYISPAQPKTGEDIHVQVKGNLCMYTSYISLNQSTNDYCTVKDVTSGKVDIDLSIMGMIKIKKQLDLCSVLGSDVMGHQDCPLSAGDLELDATGI